MIIYLFCLFSCNCPVYGTLPLRAFLQLDGQVYFSSLSRKRRDIIINAIGKGKAIPLQTWTGPEGSRRLRHEGGKVVSLTHRPPLPRGNIPDTHFC